MPATTRKHWRPVLTLLFITPLLTELLSNNLTFSKLFLPPVMMLFLMTIGYGFPVLLIREIAARRSFGLSQLVLMGLAYGIWNEGILARTLLRAYNLPIDWFDFYGITSRVAIPWAFLICSWHALHAVVYPILIVHFLFPAHRGEPWLGKSSSIVIALITLAVGGAVYFTPLPEAPAGPLPQFLIFGGIGLALFLIAPLLPRAPLIKPGGPFLWSAIRHGFCLFLAAFFIPIIFARMRIPVFLYAGYFAALFGIAFYFLVRKRELPERTMLLFMLGDEICVASFALIGACGMFSYERIATSLLFLSIFLFAIGWLRKQKIETYLPIESEEIDRAAITQQK